MAQFDGLLDVSISDQAGAGGRLIVVGQSPTLGIPPQWTSIALKDGSTLAILLVTYTTGTRTARTFVATPKSTGGLLATSTQDAWFERTIVFPTKIDAGIVLSTQVYTIEIYNAYRTQARTFSEYVNNVGAGILITDLPVLPVTIQALHSQLLTLNILADGPPQISGTLDFYLDDRIAQIVLTGQRAILFAVEPVAPLVEVLLFKTDVITKNSGKEQRISLRATPRQTFDVVYELESFDRQFLEARLFAGQARAFGLPLWAEPALATAAIQIGATTVSVDSTAYADFRDGSLAIAYQAPDNFEALMVQSHTGTSITFTSSFTKTFPVGTRVMPVRSVRFAPTAHGEKFPRTMQRTRLKAIVLDAGVDLSSTAAFPSFSGKALLDGGNKIEATLGESFGQEVVTIDSVSGQFDAFTDEAVSRRSLSKTFLTRTRQALWEARQLLHALRGRAISFYLPTFFDEFVVIQPITSGSASLDFRNFGFTKFVNAQAYRGAVRLVLKSGTTVARSVTSSAEIDSNTERLTLSSAWGVDAGLSEIDRVEYLEKSRFDSDEITIRHLERPGDATIEVPVAAVLE